MKCTSSWTLNDVLQENIITMKCITFKCLVVKIKGDVKKKLKSGTKNKMQNDKQCYTESLNL